MRVLGVDPGLTRCGVGVVEGGHRRGVSCLGVGVVRSPADDELPRRLVAIAEGVEEWIDEHTPEVVAIERVFSQQNVRSVMGTAQVSGIVALAAARRDIQVAFHTPSSVKAAISGSGKADKRQVTAMVSKVLGMSTPPKPADAADALALALCHLWRAPMAGRLAEAEQRAAELAHNHQQRLRRAARDSSGTRGNHR
ncbi:crossover junction endodeoxyribonuclease RuvC [Actinopolyspora erythraea]|uniref:Crossover junction endodeoxyribonuclease RuvC n=1 Tax=Actinopolyspora erythraea TaxID=414996 RepID=A0A099D461_9ACTN|nr:crossover junction endodeoxyribonuclease RuvC [Actinopolyspora erythraea]ASU79423.1 crossover junction endodeoxyribonuclease RuvC [Actinopolyspora erythraea]KGI80958.1 Holliday junction resolvase [Actinopolyspora erythraea]